MSSLGLFLHAIKPVNGWWEEPTGCYVFGSNVRHQPLSVRQGAINDFQKTITVLLSIALNPYSGSGLALGRSCANVSLDGWVFALK